MTADSAVPPADVRGDVYLLPAFDEYLLGYQDRNLMLPANDASQIAPGSNGVFLPIIVVDGQVVGTWKHEIRKGRVELTLNPLTHLGDRKAEVIEAANYFGAFLSPPVSVTGYGNGR